ncbi:diaminopimelate epimerase [bacterium Unc6]|nr:diaminopimelate epimerase [bacterium Unc6]
MQIKFSKITGSGNDFIVIDNRRNIILSDNKEKIAPIVRHFCDRKMGIGADGVLLLEKSKNASFRMRVFNSDGSEAEMCGNGTRCITLFAKEKRIVRETTVSKGRFLKKISIETLAGIIKAEVKNNNVKIQMSKPSDFRKDIFLKIEEKPYKLHFINTGVPHTVLIVDDIEKAPVVAVGRKIRFDPKFSPAGTNVNFVKIKDRNNIIVRTYERGVEDETLACGTGLTACCCVLAFLGLVDSPVKVKTRGGEILTVSLKKENDIIKNIFFEGKVYWVFDGKIQQVVGSK